MTYMYTNSKAIAPYHTGGSVITHNTTYLVIIIFIFLVGLKLLKTNHFFNNYKHTYR